MKNDMTERYRGRIESLLAKLADVERLAANGKRETIDGCFVGAVGLIDSLYGPNSAQAKTLFEAKKAYTKTRYSLHHELASLGYSIKGTLQNILEELDLGLIRNIATEAAGIVIGDLVALAKEELRAGFVNVAAVLASAALEDALKRKAEQLGVNTENKTMDSVINALKARSFFKGSQTPIVKSYVKLRNVAMHADWEKIQDADVSSLIGFLEPFLLEHFS